MSRSFLLILENHLIKNLGMRITTREATQSIAVSPEEKIAIEVLALAERMKAATFARHVFYRGLYQYLQDRVVHAPVMEDQVFAEVMKIINQEATLSEIKGVVERKRELERPRSAKEAAEEYDRIQRERAEEEERIKNTPITAKELGDQMRGRRKPTGTPENQRIPVTPVKFAPEKKKK
jgi:hypothetical protein